MPNPLALLWFLALLLVPACSRPAAEPALSRLEFWTINLSPTFDDYIRGLMAEFEASHPGVRLSWTDLPQDVLQQKLMAAIAGGVPPDLVNLNTGFALVMAQHGALVDMGGAVPRPVQERYFPGLWEATRYRGSVYAVPWYVTTRVLMYNRALFRRAGLDPDHPPATWEEVVEVARAVRRRTGVYDYIPVLRVVEEDRAVFDSPEGVKRLEWYVRLFREGLVPPETLVEGYRGALDAYKQGRLAILEAGPQFLLRIRSDAPEVYRETGVAPLPRTPTGLVPASTMNFAVPRSSRNRKLAVELALYLTRPESQLEFCKRVPILPSTVESARDEFFQKGTGDPLQDRAVRISVEQLSRARDFSLGLPHQADLMRALQEAVEQAVLGKSSPGEALREAARRWNRILEAG